ncbi:unnamed protein product [Gongylonema pulchrum]|uniref:Uncharacterized protein n=1 Tax=Gongylonema pulchrum TaxID=637853 RepID=A0A183DGP4_9BILA|nr:unnamed protein product [Gongylonema pulchrum]
MVKIDLSEETDLDPDLNLEHEPSEQPMLVRPSTTAAAAALTTSTIKTTTEVIS